MAISENGNGVDTTMLVSPNGYGNGGDFGFGGGGLLAWFLVAMLFGGWGGFGGMGGYGGYGNMMLGYDFPWLLNGQNGINANTNAGFQNLATQNAITAVQSDLGDIQTQLCNGFAGVNATINGTAANAETSANARAMASMQQMFGLSQQFADCCCENRLASCQTQNVIQNEAAATRAANASNTQSILDKLCQLELDGVKAQVEAKNDRIAELQTQLNMANLAASQTAQTAALKTAAAETANLAINEMRSCPIPAQPVYGNTPIFTCNNNGCGCGAA